MFSFDTKLNEAKTGFKWRVNVHFPFNKIFES